ncbi:MAG TPA: hypothetical protein PLJ35_05115 [Anaerolineae bacterium]|nr:hypothetical protein [Anaerolineae bacterium]
MSDLPEITDEMLASIERVAEAEGDAALPHGPEWLATITPSVVLALVREVRGDRTVTGGLDVTG